MPTCERVTLERAGVRGLSFRHSARSMPSQSSHGGQIPSKISALGRFVICHATRAVGCCLLAWCVVWCYFCLSVRKSQVRAGCARASCSRQARKQRAGAATAIYESMLLGINGRAIGCNSSNRRSVCKLLSSRPHVSCCCALRWLALALFTVLQNSGWTSSEATHGALPLSVSVAIPLLAHQYKHCP